jgi:hypothetical protein
MFVSIVRTNEDISESVALIDLLFFRNLVAVCTADHQFNLEWKALTDIY